MRRAVTVLGFTAVLASAVASLTLSSEPTEAAPAAEATFVVPANDGYGIADCLASGSGCGQIVADAWCETQGFRRAIAFGLTGPADVTGSVQQASTGPALRGFSVTCSN